MTTPPPPPRPAVVLLSGGLDSATTLALARAAGFACHALSFDYGQRHRIELDAARRVAAALGVASHRFATIDLRAFGGSALTSDTPVPKDRDVAHAYDIPVTYVPARNTIFLSYGVGLAEVLGARDLFIGVNALDYSGYPDCRPGYIAAFEAMANRATRAGVEAPPGEQWLTLHTPLIDLPKVEVIRRGLELGVDYALTHSCYDPDAAGHACGRCDACLIRVRAFEQLGRRDPALG